MSSRRSALVSMLAVFVGVVLAAISGRSLAAGPGTEGDPARPGVLVVTVCDPDGKAVPGARVEVRWNERVIAHGLTNREGKFAVRPIHPGKFGVGASKLGVGAGRAPAEVKPGEKTDVKIVLKKK